MKISRSQLFLTELIAAILLFALCMAVCAGVFLRAHHLSQESRQQTQALYAAQTVAEAFVAAPELSQLARQFDGQVTSHDIPQLTVGYTKDWTICPPEQAKFLLKGTLTQLDSYWELLITVETATGQSLGGLSEGVYIGSGGGEHVS